MNTDQLKALRKEIDRLNREIVALLSERARIAQRVGIVKGGGQIYLPSREAEVLAQVRGLNKGPLGDQALQSIFVEIIAACRNLERQLVVAYLGPEGTYSQEAALRFAGRSSTFLPYNSIDEACAAVEKGTANIAIVPVENSTEGAVNRTLDILADSRMRVCGEVQLAIHHQLLTHAGELAGITEVLAHPQTLAQCRKWLHAHLPQATLTAVASNAEAARLVAQEYTKGRKKPAGTGPRGHKNTKAAIAGVIAGELYDLPVLAANIEDSSTNTTRFWAVGMFAAEPTGNDKTSIVCSLPHRAGSLYELLGIFAKHGVNLTKLESRPLPNSLWDYRFYIDCDGHVAATPLAAALKEIQQVATQCKVLGSYPQANSAESDAESPIQERH